MMPPSPLNPAPYPEINATLQSFLDAVQDELGGQFIGLYLYGSLAGGDFNPQSSDIDFVVVTRDDTLEVLVEKIAALHAHLAASENPWAQRLEGDYIPQTTLRRYNPRNTTYPHLGVDGHFAVEQHDHGAVIQRWMLLNNGTGLAGPPLDSLIDPISAGDLRLAVVGLLDEWWRPQLVDHSRLNSCEYRTYAVLTMCRMLYTLQHGEIVSKPEAARWAQVNLEPRWARLIAQALAWNQGDTIPDLPETIEFIRYTLEKIND